MNAIVIKNLVKYFGKIKAVDGINIEVKKGEIFGFLGPNGAGKTTTIRMLLDFIRPTSGEINVLGLDAQKDTVNLKNEVGYLPSEIRLYGDWTGKEHLKFICSLKKISVDYQPLVEKFQLDLSRKVKYLSTGNKQKLSIILAILSSPKILILDEPTTGLDPLLQETIYQIIRDLKENGTTVFMSSHNLHEVEGICDRVGIIRDGKMVATESISNLRKKHIYKIKAVFEKTFNGKDFDEKGIEIVSQKDKTILLQVKGDIDKIIKKLAKFNLTDVEIVPASLEDIFIEFYK